MYKNFNSNSFANHYFHFITIFYFVELNWFSVRVFLHSRDRTMYHMSAPKQQQQRFLKAPRQTVRCKCRATVTSGCTFMSATQSLALLKHLFSSCHAVYLSILFHTVHHYSFLFQHCSSKYYGDDFARTNKSTQQCLVFSDLLSWSSDC